MVFKKGYVPTEETRKKLRLSHIGQKNNWKGGKIKKICLTCNIPFSVFIYRKKSASFCSTECYWKSLKGSKHSDEQKQKTSETLKRIGHKPPNHRGLKHSVETIEKIRSARLKQIMPHKDTSIEKKLKEALTKLNIEFKSNEPIILGIPDIFIEPNIVIFADGCYWHGCEKCFDNNKFSFYQNRVKVRDIMITEELKNKGYTVLRFWEHDINNNFEDKVLDEIIFAVKEKHKCQI